MNNKNYKKTKKQKTTQNCDSDDSNHQYPIIKDLNKIKKKYPKETKIDDYYEHDPDIYDEKKPKKFNMKRNKRKEEEEEGGSFDIQESSEDDDEDDEYYPGKELFSDDENESQKEDDNSSNKQKFTVGELVITEDNSSETTGAETSIIGGLNALPKSIRKKFIKDKIRKQKNNFIKPDVSLINIEDEEDEISIQGRCKICYYAYKGSLAKNTESLYNNSKKKHDTQSLNGVCEAGITFLSTFKMKYDEMLPWSNKHEVCDFLAKVWNNKIKLERKKHMEKIVQKKKANSADDFLKLLNDSMHIIKNDGDVQQNEDELYDQDFLLDKSLPPLITVDDVIYHFDNCIEIDQINQQREQLIELRSVQKHMFKKRIFIKKKPVTLDGTESNGKCKRDINYTAFYAWLTSLKVSREIASELRASIREERSGFLFNNLGLLRDQIPNLDSIKTINALKYNGPSKKLKGSADQYKSGLTQGI